MLRGRMALGWNPPPWVTYPNEYLCRPAGCIDEGPADD